MKMNWTNILVQFIRLSKRAQPDCKQPPCEGAEHRARAAGTTAPPQTRSEGTCFLHSQLTETVRELPASIWLRFGCSAGSQDHGAPRAAQTSRGSALRQGALGTRTPGGRPPPFPTHDAEARCQTSPRAQRPAPARSLQSRPDTALPLPTLREPSLSAAFLPGADRAQRRAVWIRIVPRLPGVRPFLNTDSV